MAEHTPLITFEEKAVREAATMDADLIVKSVAPLVSRRLKIRTGHPADYASLHAWETSTEVRFRLGERATAPTLDLFTKRMEIDPSRQFIALSHDDVPRAWMTAYNHDTEDGHVWFGWASALVGVLGLTMVAAPRPRPRWRGCWRNTSFPPYLCW